MKNLHLAPMVIGYRLATLALLTVNPTRDRLDEAQRMVAEKAIAVWSGLAAAQFVAVQGNLALWGDLLLGRNAATGIGRSLKRMHKAAVLPAERTLRANARRLSRQTA